jgi:hypothetical protein
MDTTRSAVALSYRNIDRTSGTVAAFAGANLRIT